MADQVKAEREPSRLGGLTGTQLALIAAAVVVAIAVVGIIFTSGEESTPSLEDLGVEVTTQQAQYESLLDARPRIERLIESGASPAIIAQAFDGLDVAEGTVEESAGGMDGYERFLSERLETEREHLRLASRGVASPAAYANFQRTIDDVNAELARVRARG